MQPEFRTLAVGLQSDDVKLLHDELALLGTTFPEAVRRKCHFDDKVTLLAVKAVQKMAGLDPTGVVDEATAKAITAEVDKRFPFTVQGTVTNASGTSVPDILVRAFDKDMRSEECLGETRTNSKGAYVVRYSQKQFCRAEKGTADLRVAVCEDGGREVVSSDILFNAGPTTTVDLVTPDTSRQPSELERYVEEIGPILQGVSLGELTDDDIAFVSGDTGIPLERVRWLSLASKDSAAAAKGEPTAKVRVVSKGIPGIPVEAFYGWFRLGLPTDLTSLWSRTADELVAALKTAIDQNIIPQSAATQLELIASTVGTARVDQLLAPATTGAPASLGDLFAALPAPLAVDKQRTIAGKIPGRAVAGAGGIDALSTTTLDALVAQKALTRGEADQIGLAAVAYQLTGANLAASRAVLAQAASGGPKVGQISDLAAMTESDWSKVVQQSGTTLSSGVTADQFAQVLTTRVAKLLPTDFVMHRATALPANLADLISAAQPAPSSSKSSARGATAPVVAGGAAAPGTPDALNQLVRRNPGLGLDAVISGTVKAPAKAKEIQRRIGLVSDAWTRNAGKNLLALDYSPDSADPASLGLEPLAPADRAMVLSNLRGHQRAFGAGGDAGTAVKLLDAGLDASRKVVDLRPDQLQEATGLSASQTQVVYEKAAKIATGAAVKAMAIGQLTSWSPPATRPPADSGKIFADIPGYNELFNAKGFCDCEDCQSVLGLSAYFVDLMHFVEKNVLDLNFPSLPKPPIHLAVRRPDLWTMTLSCDDATEVVAYLDVINGVLETYLQARVTGDVWETIAGRNPSFSLPFNLPLTRIETYLGYFQKRRLDAAVAFGADEHLLARARLGISEVEYAMITTPAATDFSHLSLAEQTSLSQLYSFAVTLYPNGTVDPSLSVPDVLGAMGVSRGQFAELLATAFVQAGGPVHLKSGATSAESVQNDAEIIEGLKAVHLDLLHRLYRLSRRVPWTVGELDLVVGLLPIKGLGAGLDEGAFLRIARLVGLQERLQLKVEQLCGLWSELPNVSLDGAPRLFDSIFNPPELANLGAPIDYAATSPVLFAHPSLDPAATGSSAPDDKTLATLARLLSGLRISETELYQLIVNLTQPLGLDLIDQDPTKRKLSFELSVPNLTLLYRHATLAKLLGLSIPALFQLLVIAQNPATSTTSAPTMPSFVHDWSMNGAVLVDDLSTLLDTSAWIQASTYSIDQIAFIVGQTPIDSTKLPDGVALVEAIVSQLVGDPAFEFAETVLSGLPNGTLILTEDQSRQVIQLNLNVGSSGPFEPVPGRSTLRLKATVVPEPTASTITIPAGLTVTAADVAEKLSQFSIHRLLPPRLASALKVSDDRFAALLQLSGQAAQLDSGSFLQSVASVAYGTGTAADRTKLATLVTTMLPHVVLFGDPIYDGPTLAFIRQSVAAFSLSAAPTPEAVRLAAGFQTLVAGPNAAYATSAQAPDASAVRETVATTTGPTPKGLALAGSEVLARALRTDAARIDSLLPSLKVQLPATGLAIDQLGQMARCLDVMSLLGIGGQTLSDLASPSTATTTEYQLLRRAADALFAGFRAKYASDEDFQEKIEPYEDKLRSRTRDGLVAYLRFNDPTRFSDETDLYRYFLVDVEVEGCARTTRVAAAVFSVQLYVHRVLMQLEQGDGNPPFVVSAANILSEDWAWRQHYRLWQANRKVFLYPENYLDPALRDDKTPLFEDLEDALLQQNFSEQNVRNVYAKYLAGFDELARLRIVAACSQSPPPNPSDAKDVLHLLAVTSSEPPRYYYRAICGFQEAGTTKDGCTSTGHAEFGPWNAVDLNISAKTCSATLYSGALYIFWAEILTQPKNAIVDGGSQFQGYTHKVALKFASLQLDGRWTAAQRLRIVTPDGEMDRILVDDPLNPVTVTLRSGDPSPVDGQVQGFASDGTFVIFDNQQKGQPLPGPARTYPFVQVVEPTYGQGQRHYVPHDDYSLVGVAWDTPYPALERSTGLFKLAYGFDLSLGCGQCYELDLYNRTATFLPGDITQWTYPGVALLRDGNGATLGIGHATVPALFPYSFYRTSSELLREGLRGTTNDAIILGSAVSDSQRDAVALNPIDADGFSPGVPSDWSFIVTLAGDSFYVRVGADASSLPWVCRLGSAIGIDFPRKLFSQGLEALLSIGYQLSPSALLARFTLPEGGVWPEPEPDFSGAMAVYYREIFCHIAWVIADHLHSQGQFGDAQRWYHFIFNPTAPDNPPANSAYGRVWQFSQFRQDQEPNRIPSMRAALTDGAALDVYRKDPFSPHAIARLRPGAYEKAMVMQYIDNLLDWGDSLFIQFTSESINEATMLYILASDILGARAPDVGDCGDGGSPPITYATLSLSSTSDFLVEMENVWRKSTGEPIDKNDYAQLAKRLAAGSPGTALDPVSSSSAGAGHPLQWQGASGTLWSQSGGTAIGEMTLGARIHGTAAGPTLPQIDLAGLPQISALPGGLGDGGYQPPVQKGPTLSANLWQLVDSTTVFCIPDNQELRAYWDRVDDRLYKIRNCMDITGARRLPDLFGPPIDPHLLVQMKALGLSLSDVLNVTAGNVPPYRFMYLLEKARQYAGVVQSFGSALLSALEKRDAESLSQLRTVHEQHLLKLRTQLQEFEIAAAQQALAGVQLQQQAAEYRRDYYTALSQTGLTPWEQTQQVSAGIVSNLRETEAVTQLVRAALSLLPDIGAPTGMKYGGIAVSGAAAGFASASQALAQGAEAVASSAGLEAGFQRRDDEWRHQAALAQRDVDQLAKQAAAADIRVQIAQRSLEVHNETIDQTEEVFEFYQDKFTGLGLYDWLSSTLQSLYRDAYNSALSMAMLADQSYRFERPDDSAGLDLAGVWDPAHGGLLAGERLTLALQSLERKYLETDYRLLEIDQAFSLAQIDPGQLLQLREQGECQFELPELFFDLAYPGHYRRRIKAVRLTLPCVTGPYANASATLRLVGGRIRMNDDSNLDAFPVRHAVSIAASSAQNDPGVFEFNFRDERYMPFEGNGAVSTWQLSLPKSFRLFDYRTISDVILRISYSALESDSLRQKVEDLSGTLEQSLLKDLQNQELQCLLSLRHDLPDTFARLMGSATNIDVPFTIDANRRPWFLSGRTLNITGARVVLRTKNLASAPATTLSLDTADVGKFAADTRGSTQPKQDSLFVSSGDVSTHVGSWFGQDHTITLTDSTNGSDILDVLLDIRYKVGTV